MADSIVWSLRFSPVILVKLFVLLLVQGNRLSFGQSDPAYVAVVRSTVATTENPTVIEVYRGTSDATVEFDKAVLRGGPVSNQRYDFRGNVPPVPVQSVIDITNEPATLMLPVSLTPSQRTGIYTISVTEGEETFSWRVLITNEDATIRAVEYSTVLSRGDPVTVSVDSDVHSGDVRWRRNGVWYTRFGYNNCSRSLSCTDASISPGMFVFECHEAGRYGVQEHGIMNVIVRECEHNKWNPPGCMNGCQPCINGGICSDLTGSCLCPPGFSGNHCENVHGSNVFGQNAEYRCDNSSDDHSAGCQGAMICYPNPFGCICPAGYTGLDCMQSCERRKFGANCKQECHCSDNSLCASDTGVCEGGECEDGYKGTNCQLRVVCPPGVYGVDFCNIPCSCETEDCSDVEANCTAGCAVPWTGLACNQNTGDGIINLSYVKVNTGQVSAVRCSVLRNPLVLAGDLILTPVGTPCLDCGNENSDRSYNLTKTVMITLSTSMEVTCSVRNTNVMETTMLVPYVLPAYASSDVLTFPDVTSTSITVRWPSWNNMYDFGDGPVIRYRIQWREYGTETFSEIRKGTDLVHQFLDLTPDTLYEFRIILVREGQGGEGAPSNVQRQRTLCDVFPSVTDLSVTAEGQGQLEVTWNRPDSNCIITSYTVSYRFLTYLACLATPTEGDTDTMTTQVLSTSYVISHLSNYANYSVTVRTNQNGEQEMMTAVTNQSSPSEPPTNVQLVRNTSTELEFSWDPPHCQSQNGIITNYSYQLQSQDNRTVREGTMPLQEVVIANLLPYTEYSFVVRASTSKGPGPPSDVIIARTAEDIPGPPRNVNVTDRNMTSLTVEWTTPVNPNGIITHYRLQVRAIEKLYDQQFVLSDFNGSIEITNQGENNIHVLNELEPSTHYEIKISAFTIIGQGDNVTLEARTDLFTDLQALATPPEIDFRGTTATLTLPALDQQYASAYYIRVERRNSTARQKRDIDGFVNFSQNPDHYIAAEVEKNEQEMEFTIGDGETYGGYFNAPLHEETTYNAYIGIGSKAGEDVFVSWSEPVAFGLVPGPPRDLNVANGNETSLTIEWSIPLNHIEIITHYQLQFRAIEKLHDLKFVLGEFGQSINVPTQGENNVYVLSELEPSTLYEIQISAFTAIGQGASVCFEAGTDLFKDLEALPAHALPEIDFQGTTATLILPALSQRYASAYYIRVEILNSADIQKRDVDGFGNFSQNPDHYIAAEVEKNEQEMQFTIGDGEIYGDYFNAPLQEETSYNAFIGIGSKAGEDVAVSWSEPIAFGPSPDFPVVIVAVVAAVVVLTVLLLVGFIYCRRSSPKAVHNDHDLGPSVENPVFSNDLSHTNEEVAKANVYDDPPMSSRFVEISNLVAYVREKKGNSEDNFVTQFQALPTNQLYPWKVAEKPENKTKNRYGNIIPYDDSRVVLELIEGDPHSDYINASYIDGYKSPKKFIASHGANKASVIDFWRMVWQEDVARIVMLTPLVEGKARKCLKYWPDSEMVYGEYFVRCQDMKEHSKYTERTFSVSLKHGSDLKTVKHFHFTDWNDMKVPEFLDPTLKFLKIVRKDYGKQGGRTIVHCSAGVGRTGTYITLDAMLDMGQAEQQINVFEFVKQMRHRRIQSVQVKEQYEFIFDTLVKHFCIGRTTMPVESFRSELSGLKQVNSATGNTFIMDQYKKLEETTWVTTQSEVREGVKKENKDKNRSSQLLPVETHRPLLMTAVEDIGSNYINATFLHGYKQKDFFIATQMPLKNTIVDFWRLVWDYNCSVVIMLNSLENQNEQYWPDSAPVTFAPFTVVPFSSDYQGNVCVRKMEVCNSTLQFQNYRTVHQIQCIDWPNHEITATKSSEVLIRCTHLLKKLCSESTVDHVLVHCIDGVGRTGIFCGLVAALDQAKAEQEVDIFQLVANMRKAQPLMIQNLEQYQCIFDSVLSDLESDGNAYQNV